MAIEHVSSDNAQLLQQIADSIANSRRIVAIAGAGISTNCGIPDFRSENGLYSLLKPGCTISPEGAAARSQRVSGKELFDASLWRSEFSTSLFYQFIGELRSKVREVERATATHKFMKTLRDKRKLVRMYTQNIDGLEGRVGLSRDMARGVGSKQRFAKKWTNLPAPNQSLSNGKLDGGCEVVGLHGDLDILRCTICQEESNWEIQAEELFRKGQTVDCSLCTTRHQERLNRGKRGLPVGNLRPNIVLYGEEHPASDQISKFLENDIALVDVCLIFGTSLKVHGLKNIVRQFANAAHSRKHGKGKVIFINNTQPAESIWGEFIDSWVSMDCDAFVKDVRARRPDIWTTQAVLSFSVSKSLNPPKVIKPPPSLDKENISPDSKNCSQAWPTWKKKRAALGSTTVGNILQNEKPKDDASSPSLKNGGQKRKRRALEEPEDSASNCRRVRTC